MNEALDREFLEDIRIATNFEFNFEPLRYIFMQRKLLANWINDNRCDDPVQIMEHFNLLNEQIKKYLGL